DGDRRWQIEIDLPFDGIGLEGENKERQELKGHVEHGGQVQRDFFRFGAFPFVSSHDLASAARFMARRANLRNPFFWHSVRTLLSRSKGVFWSARTTIRVGNSSPRLSF